MSYSVDVNLLLYASDEASPLYQPARRFLKRCGEDPDIFFLCWPTVFSYLRISTHPRIFANPLSPKEALANVEALLRLPRVRTASEGEDFLNVYRDISRRFPVRGNLVSDAHIAALLLQNGVRTIYTSDTDFRKFAFLDVRDPFLP